MVEPSPSIPNASPKNQRQTRSGTARRTESEQQTYSSKKLIKRVCSLRRADSGAAAKAKSQWSWSRATLKRYLKRKRTSPDSRFRKPMFGKKLPELQSKVRALNRLIPGCRKLSLPSLIEEATDYIADLEMQVKAMALLTAIMNGAATPAAFLPSNL